MAHHAQNCSGSWKTLGKVLRGPDLGVPSGIVLVDSLSSSRVDCAIPVLGRRYPPRSLPV
eukprot:6048827-Pyramimonas_sp.AAC.1